MVGVFTAAEQAQAFETYIQQDKYLSEHRGEYAKRGAVFLPLVHRLDFSVTQDLFANIGGKRNAFQLRFDIQNFGNLLEQRLGRRATADSQSDPDQRRPEADTSGRTTYGMVVVNNELLTRSLEKTAGFNDVYSFMISLRYSFN